MLYKIIRITLFVRDIDTSDMFILTIYNERRPMIISTITYSWPLVQTVHRKIILIIQILLSTGSIHFLEE